MNVPVRVFWRPGSWALPVLLEDLRPHLPPPRVLYGEGGGGRHVREKANHGNPQSGGSSPADPLQTAERLAPRLPVLASPWK